MKQCLWSLVAGLLLAGVSGCWFAPETSYETHYYGLMEPESRVWPFTVGAVSNDSGVVNRMVYRTAAGERVVDEYRRWLLSPDAMLANYFRDGAQTEKTALPVYDLRIYRFDADLAKKTVNLGVEWRKQGTDGASGWMNFRCEAPFAEATPEAMAAAFSDCAEQLGKELEHK